MKYLTFLAILGWVILLPLRADIINVSADLLTIQTGIDSAMSGDTVLVLDGLYYENIDFIGKSVTVGSHFLMNGDTSHISNTIINGNQPGSPHRASTVTFSTGGDTSSVLCGFTITGGTGTYVLDYKGMVGGGIIISHSGCKIQYNKIINNSLEFYAGGGIAGAGIGSIIDSTNVVIIENNIIHSNIGQGISAWGGGAFLYGKIIGGTNGYYRIFNNLICDNILTATLESAGGGIMSNYSILTMINNTIVNNHSQHWEGGLSFYGSKADIINCIIWNNVSPDNSQIYASVSDLNVVYSNIQEGFRGEGNIDKNPEFVNSVERNYRLKDFSPCLGSGVENVNIQGEQFISPVYDIYGRGRPFPVGSKPDIGAYESVLAIPDWVSPNLSYINPANDTLVINALIQNSDNHMISARTNIVSTDIAIADSVLLFDDGLHEDGLAGDKIWGGKMNPVNIESEFIVELVVYDIDLDHTYNRKDVTRFTSIGPIAVDSFEVSSVNTETIILKLYMKNKGSITTAQDITVYIASTDTNVTNIDNNNRNFRDIEAGQIKTALPYAIYTSQDPKIVELDLSVFSKGILFWKDTITVDIVTASIEREDNLPITFNLVQNYPNPFNPKTIINYQLPITNDVDISIYNLLGQKVAALVSEKQKAGHHQVEWDASGFASGIYYYMIKAGEFQDVKKMILLR